MSVPVLCRSTTVGVAFSSIVPFQHTACLLKDIYSPGTLHMRMTRSIVPRGTERCPTPMTVSVLLLETCCRCQTHGYQTEDLCGQFLTTSYVLESLQSSESYISGTIDQLENLASVRS